MTRALDVIEDYLEWRGLSWLRLDGGTSTADRGDLVKEFNHPGDSRDSQQVPFMLKNTNSQRF